jgi:hypothetical protein
LVSFFLSFFLIEFDIFFFFFHLHGLHWDRMLLLGSTL